MIGCNLSILSLVREFGNRYLNMCLLEFASKTLFLFSLRKNEQIDLSCLPDEEFDKVISGLSATRMCREGSSFTGMCG